jgi:putative ABC transport system substrate-binding protein
MHRREIITLLGSAPAWRLVAGEHNPALSVVALLGTESREASAERLRLFRDALAEAGHVDGRDVMMEAARSGSPRWPAISPASPPP